LDTELCRRILENMSRVIVGKGQSLELLLVALLADGHVLIEDVPGVGKTLMAKCLARQAAVTTHPGEMTKKSSMIFTMLDLESEGAPKG
jgi:MoxR-like ATPase